MREPIVSVVRLGKRYRLRHRADEVQYRTLRDTIVAGVSAPFRWLAGARVAAAAPDDFWALQDISLTIASGEVVGIIGRNGAGKSTLLKILSRITEPTTGRVELSGRVASLLEVGTGFHPELSGRENIFLNAAILGMTRAETTRKFDEIVAFAEVERFLDTPVKRYSSGMYVRLAFAVAAHLEPEILIVDEVLAVGDAEFQKRCLGKMHEVSRTGRTVLFVSHNMAAIQTLCGRAIWLDGGRLAAVGGVTEIIGQYLSVATGRSVDRSATVRIGSDIELLRFALTPNPVTSGGRVDFEIELRATDATKIGHITLLIHSLLDVRLAILDLRPLGFPVTLAANDVKVFRGSIRALPLVEGDYSVGFGLGSSNYIGDALGLLDLRVLPQPPAGGIVPYAAEYRGIVELDLVGPSR